MEKKEFIDSIGKKVRIVLKNGFYYKCVIDDVGEDYIKVTDLRGSRIVLAISEVTVLEVKG